MLTGWGLSHVITQVTNHYFNKDSGREEVTHTDELLAALTKEAIEDTKRVSGDVCSQMQPPACRLARQCYASWPTTILCALWGAMIRCLRHAINRQGLLFSKLK